jgi:hypothetical protein
VQGYMNKGQKRRASAPAFVRQTHLVIEGFETPFSQKLSTSNRWFVLTHKIPWDEICNV